MIDFSFFYETNLVRQIPLIKEQSVTQGFHPPNFGPKHQQTFNDGVDGTWNQGHAEGDGATKSMQSL